MSTSIDFPLIERQIDALMTGLWDISADGYSVTHNPAPNVQQTLHKSDIDSIELQLNLVKQHRGFIKNYDDFQIIHDTFYWPYYQLFCIYRKYGYEPVHRIDQTIEIDQSQLHVVQLSFEEFKIKKIMIPHVKEKEIPMDTSFNPYVQSSIGKVIFMYKEYQNFLKTPNFFPCAHFLEHGIDERRLFPLAFQYFYELSPLDNFSQFNKAKIMALLEELTNGSEFMKEEYKKMFERDFYNFILPIAGQLLGSKPNEKEIEELLSYVQIRDTDKECFKNGFKLGTQLVPELPQEWIHSYFQIGSNFLTQLTKKIKEGRCVALLDCPYLRNIDSFEAIAKSCLDNNIHLVSVPSPGDCYHVIAPLRGVYYTISHKVVDKKKVHGILPTVNELIWCNSEINFPEKIASITDTNSFYMIVHPEGLSNVDITSLKHFIQTRLKKLTDLSLPRVVIITSHPSQFPDIAEANKTVLQDMAPFMEYTITARNKISSVETEINLVFSPHTGVGKTKYICTSEPNAQHIYIDESMQTLSELKFEADVLHLCLSPKFFKSNFTFFDNMYFLTLMNFFFLPMGQPLSLKYGSVPVKKMFFEIPALHNGDFNPMHFPIVANNWIQVGGSAIQTIPRSIKFTHCQIEDNNYPIPKEYNFSIFKQDTQPKNIADLIKASFGIFFPKEKDKIPEITPRIQRHFVDFLKTYPPIAENTHSNSPAMLPIHQLLLLRTSLHVLNLVPETKNVMLMFLVSHIAMQQQNATLVTYYFERFSINENEDTWDCNALIEGLSYKNDQDIYEKNNKEGNQPKQASIFDVLRMFPQNFTGKCSQDLQDYQKYLHELMNSFSNKPNTYSTPDAEFVKFTLAIEGCNPWKKLDKPAEELKELKNVQGHVRNIKSINENIRNVFGEFEINIILLQRIITVLLQMKSGFPSILSGHTGCGKSALYSLVKRLITFYQDKKNFESGICHCAFKMATIDCHAGKGYAEILHEIQLIRGDDTNKHVVIFFDELNTSPAQDFIIYYILNSIQPNISFFGAINPYIKLSEVSQKISKVGIVASLPQKASRIKICSDESEYSFEVEDQSVYAYNVHETPRDILFAVNNCSQKQEEDNYLIFNLVKRKLLIFYFSTYFQINKKRLPVTCKYFIHQIQFTISLLNKIFNVLRTLNQIEGVLSFRDVRRFISFYKMFLFELLPKYPEGKTDPEIILELQQKLIMASALSFMLCFYLGQPKTIDVSSIKNVKMADDTIITFAQLFAKTQLDNSFLLETNILKLRDAIQEICEREFSLFDKCKVSWLTLLKNYCFRECIKFCQDKTILKTESLLFHLFTIESCYKLNQKRMKKYGKKAVSLVSCMFIGWPGTSKTMAIKLFVKYYQESLHCFSYLCTPTASSESFESLFKSCYSYEQSHQKGPYDFSIKSLAFFDEIGLALQSTNNAAKSLHSLSDKGVNIGNDQFYPIFHATASNYAMDYANMNRWIHVCTDQIDLEDFQRACSLSALDKVPFPPDKTIYSPDYLSLIVQVEISGSIKKFAESVESQKLQFHLGMRSLFLLNSVISSQEKSVARIISCVQNILRNGGGSRLADAVNEAKKLGIPDIPDDEFDANNSSSRFLKGVLNDSSSNRSYCIETDDYDILPHLSSNLLKDIIGEDDDDHKVLRNEPIICFESDFQRTREEVARDFIQNVLIPQIRAATTNPVHQPDPGNKLPEQADSKQSNMGFVTIPKIRFRGDEQHTKPNLKGQKSETQTQLIEAQIPKPEQQQQQQPVPRQPIFVVGNHPASGALLDFLNSSSSTDQTVLLSHNGYTYQIDRPNNPVYIFFIVDKNDIKSDSPFPLALSDRLDHIYLQLKDICPNHQIKPLPKSNDLLFHESKGSDNFVSNEPFYTNETRNAIVLTRTPILHPIRKEFDSFGFVEKLENISSSDQLRREAAQKDVMIQVKEEPTALLTYQILFNIFGFGGHSDFKHYLVYHLNTRQTPTFFQNIFEYIPLIWCDDLAIEPDANVSGDITIFRKALRGDFTDIEEIVKQKIKDSYFNLFLSKYSPKIEINDCFNQQDLQEFNAFIPQLDDDLKAQIVAILSDVNDETDRWVKIVNIFCTSMEKTHPYIQPALQIRINNPGSVFKTIYEFISHPQNSWFIPYVGNHIKNAKNATPTYIELLRPAFSLLASDQFIGSIKKVTDYIKSVIETFTLPNNKVPEEAITLGFSKIDLLEKTANDVHYKYFDTDTFFSTANLPKVPKINNTIVAKQYDDSHGDFNVTFKENENVPSFFLQIVKQLSIDREKNFAEILKQHEKMKKHYMKFIWENLMNYLIFIHPLLSPEEIASVFTSSEQAIPDFQNHRSKLNSNNFQSFCSQYLQKDQLVKGGNKSCSIVINCPPKRDNLDGINITQISVFEKKRIKHGEPPQVSNLIQEIADHFFPLDEVDYLFDSFFDLFNEEYRLLDIELYYALTTNSTERLGHLFDPFNIEENVRPIVGENFFTSVVRFMAPEGKPIKIPLVSQAEDIKQLVTEVLKAYYTQFQIYQPFATTDTEYIRPAVTISTLDRALLQFFVTTDRENNKGLCDFLKAFPFRHYLSKLIELYKAMNNLKTFFKAQRNILLLLLKVCDLTTFVEVLTKLEIKKSDIEIFEYLNTLKTDKADATVDFQTVQKKLTTFVERTIQIYDALIIRSRRNGKFTQFPIKALHNAKKLLPVSINVVNTFIANFKSTIIPGDQLTLMFADLVTSVNKSEYVVLEVLPDEDVFGFKSDPNKLIVSLQQARDLNNPFCTGGDHLKQIQLNQKIDQQGDVLILDSLEQHMTVDGILCLVYLYSSTTFINEQIACVDKYLADDNEIKQLAILRGFAEK